MTPPAPRKTARQVTAFIIVGVSATVTHFTVGLVVFYVLPLNLSALWTNFIAFCIAFLVTYFGNALFVFPETRLGPASFMRFLSVSLVSLGLNQIIVYVLVERFTVPYWQALIVVLMVIPPATFFGMKYWGVRGLGPGSDRP